MSRTDFPEKHACITGIGQTKAARPSDRTALQLTVEACRQAIADAGLTPADIDGIATYPAKSNEGGGISPTGTTEVTFAMGLAPTWAGGLSEGHGHLSAMEAAIMAIASGTCRHVLVFRTVAQATARVTARESTLLGGSAGGRVDGNNAWTVPFGAVSPVNMWALYAQAYFDKYGATSEQLGQIAVNGRRNAAHNPNAIYTKPLSLDDYLAARMISSPLRLYDCDTHIDGSTAILVSARDAARDTRNPPILIEAAGYAIGGIGAGLHTGDFTSLPATRAGAMLWSHTDMTPAEVDCAQIYDGFSIHTWLWMEAVKLCKPGEAAAFVEGGTRIALDGELPLNTGGGQLSAGRFHGYGHVHEACVQLWGRGGGRQVKEARTAIAVAGGYGYGAVLLRRE